MSSSPSRLPAAQAVRSLFDQWVADPELFRAAAREDNPALKSVIEEAARNVRPLPIFHHDGLAAAVVDARGALVWSDGRFRDWMGTERLSLALIDAVRNDGVVRSDLVSGAGLLVYVRAASARLWPLEAEAHEALTQPRASVLVLVLSAARSERPLVEAAQAYGLTAMETRLAVALVRHANLPAAAQAAGLTYNTARQALKACLRKTGSPRQSALVTLLSQAATGAAFDAGNATAALIDMFGLRPREAELALLLSQGMTRSEAARAVSMSDAVAKDAYARIFQKLDVTSGPELSRLIMEVLAASLVSSASGGELMLRSGAGEPLRFIPRRKGGFIAVSDFGPPTGAPVFVLHTSGTTRHPSRKLVRALMARGMRPIAIDRPGFGLSDAFGDGARPFEDAADDMAELCEALGFERVDILARGGTHAAYAFARRYPERVGEVVLLNPDTRPNLHRSDGVLGAVQDMLANQTGAVRWLAEIVSTQGTPQRVRQLLNITMKSSPADLEAFRDDEALEDYHRSVMMLANGRTEGFVREHKAHAAGVAPTPLADASSWRVLIGARDPLYAAEDIERFWRPLLPGARFETFAEGGRFLHLTHTDAVVAALRPA